MGEPHHIMYEMLDVLQHVMPFDKPRYLMGVGHPSNLVEGVARGWICLCCCQQGMEGQVLFLFLQGG